MPVTVEAPLTDGMISSSLLKPPVRDRERRHGNRASRREWEG